jgi:hypothetical protein
MRALQQWPRLCLLIALAIGATNLPAPPAHAEADARIEVVRDVGGTEKCPGNLFRARVGRSGGFQFSQSVLDAAIRDGDLSVEFRGRDGVFSVPPESITAQRAEAMGVTSSRFIILLDASISMRQEGNGPDKWGMAMEALRQFLDRLGAYDTRVIIAPFATGFGQASEFTESQFLTPDRAKAYLEELRNGPEYAYYQATSFDEQQNFRCTALYNAVAEAHIGITQQLAQHEQDGTKYFLVVISDGANDIVEPRTALAQVFDGPSKPTSPAKWYLDEYEMNQDSRYLEPRIGELAPAEDLYNMLYADKRYTRFVIGFSKQANEPRAKASLEALADGGGYHYDVTELNRLGQTLEEVLESAFNTVFVSFWLEGDRSSLNQRDVRILLPGSSETQLEPLPSEIALTSSVRAALEEYERAAWAGMDCMGDNDLLARRIMIFCVGLVLLFGAWFMIPRFLWGDEGGA